MKKRKLSLLAIVLVGISLAWANKPFHNTTYHTYEYFYTYYGRVYYLKDLTANGYVKGNQYACDAADYECTFMAFPGSSQTDNTGNFFWISDIPTEGIDNTGFYFEF